jgi:hypothetical protein
MFELFYHAELTAGFIVPEEYGLESPDKLKIGSLIASPLMQKITDDIHTILDSHLKEAKGETIDKKPRMFAYFTSESHLHSLRNILMHSHAYKQITEEINTEKLSFKEKQKDELDLHTSLNSSGSSVNVNVNLDPAEIVSSLASFAPHFHDFQKPIHLNYMCHYVFQLWEDTNQPKESPKRFFIKIGQCKGTRNPFSFTDEQHIQSISPISMIHSGLTVSDFDKFSAIANSIKQQTETSPSFQVEHK